MRLVYLNADPGIPLVGPKGASVHVRSLLRALAPRVDSLTCVPFRVAKGRGDDREVASIPARVVVPDFDPIHGDETSRGSVSAERAGMAANDAFERTLDDLARSGEMDVLVERYSLWGVAGARVAERWGIPWLLEVDAPLAEEAARYRSLAMPSVAGFLEDRIFRAAGRLLVVSRELAEYAVAHGAPRDRVVVLPNGVDDELFRPAPVSESAAPPAAPRPFTITFVGSLKPWHGVDVLVEAFLRTHASDPNCRLRLVGAGPMADSVRARLAASLPPGAWTMDGGIPHEEIPAVLHATDVAVAPYAPSGSFYFSPLKVMEYAATCVPIVASRLGQIAEILPDEEAALLVPPGDPEALAGAISRLRDDAVLRLRLAARARTAVRHRTWGSVADEIVRHAGALRDEAQASRAAGQAVT